MIISKEVEVIAKIINEVLEMRNFTTEGITVTEAYTLPSGVRSASVEIWAAGDFSSSSEYIIAKVDGVQIGGQLSTGSDGSTMMNVLTYDLTSLVEGKQTIELSITTSSSMNPGVGVGGSTSCWVDWRFTFEVSTAKLLIEDGTEIKAWNAINSSYEKVGDLPLTEDMFTNFGMEELPVSFEGILSNAPKLHLYTADANVTVSPELYKVELIEKKRSLPKVVIENMGRTLQQTIGDIIVDDLVSGTGDLQYALSKDKVTWYAFDALNTIWQVVDVTNDMDFANKGMRKADFSIIKDIHYGEIFAAGDTLYLTFRFYKGTEGDECKFLGVRVNYTSPIQMII
ncbi:hypothetical protein [Clostridium sp. KNHs214]|uniref:hypothetical protein n=1 Tax=Clostridium sp. KNHs214 TaxID=1540257 RepID=UPI00054F19C7|nr:hypothetical protein [Clostridium sp. KNHs214]